LSIFKHRSILFVDLKSVMLQDQHHHCLFYRAAVELKIRSWQRSYHALSKLGINVFTCGEDLLGA
jgi:hypothetical protein